MPVSEKSLANLRPIPAELRYHRQGGEIGAAKQIRIAERIARKLDHKKLPLNVHLVNRAYEKDGVLMKVVDKLFPNATPDKQIDEVKTNKVEVYIEFGISNIQDKAQRSSGEGNFLDIEASAMSPEQG